MTHHNDDIESVISCLSGAGPPAFPFQLTDIPLEFKHLLQQGASHLLSVTPALSVTVPRGWEDRQPQTRESAVSPVEP